VKASEVAGEAAGDGEEQEGKNGEAQDYSEDAGEPVGERLALAGGVVAIAIAEAHGGKSQRAASAMDLAVRRPVKVSLPVR